WLNIIENMNTDNTYKIVWGKSILECINHKNYEETDRIKISLSDIAHNIIKYYWNQIFFFDLKQSPYVDKEPTVCTEIKKLIDKYKELENTQLPIWYDKGINLLKEKNIDFFNDVHLKITKTLRLDVAYRFKNVPNNTLEIYEYTKNDYYIYFDKESIILLNEYNIILAELLNFKWSLLLEQYNNQPKISSKVKGSSSVELKRKSLKRYKDILLAQFNNGQVLDFYTNEPIDINDVSIDHVIPWSFMYSDDIWNLVVTSKSNNSKKSNKIPSKDIIGKLNIRNKYLIEIVDDNLKKELEYAIDNDLVDKYYYDCRV
ncbi:MAG: HNH endonuclease domain-containing protein, partial [bacterium]